MQVSARANQGAICPDRAPRDARDVAGACRAMAQKSGSGIPDLVAEIILRRASAKPLSLFVADIVVGHWFREKVADLTALTFSDFNFPIPCSVANPRSIWRAMAIAGVACGFDNSTATAKHV